MITQRIALLGTKNPTTNVAYVWPDGHVVARIVVGVMKAPNGGDIQLAEWLCRKSLDEVRARIAEHLDKPSQELEVIEKDGGSFHIAEQASKRAFWPRGCEKEWRL